MQDFNDYLNDNERFEINFPEQHFHNLIFFIEENQIQNFNNYIDKIMSFDEGKNILQQIFYLNNQNEIIGSLELDDVSITPYDYMIFYTINQLQYDFFKILLRYDYPLEITTNLEGQYYNVIEYLVKLCRTDREYYSMLNSINYLDNKNELINKNLDIFTRSLELAKTEANLEAIEILNRIINNKDTKCIGCIEEQPNQLAHADINGCCYDPDFY